MLGKAANSQRPQKGPHSGLRHVMHHQATIAAFMIHLSSHPTYGLPRIGPEISSAASVIHILMRALPKTLSLYGMAECGAEAPMLEMDEGRAHQGHSSPWTIKDGPASGSLLIERKMKFTAATSW